MKHDTSDNDVDALDARFAIAEGDVRRLKEAEVARLRREETATAAPATGPIGGDRNSGSNLGTMWSQGPARATGPVEGYGNFGASIGTTWPHGPQGVGFDRDRGVFSFFAGS